MRALLLAPMGSIHRRFNRANIEALKELDYEVHLLANFSQGEGTEQQNTEYVKQCEESGITIHSLPFERHSLTSSFLQAKATRALIEREQFDLVHSHTETGGLILRLAGHRKGTRYLYTPHGMSFYNGSSWKSQLIYRPIEKWICAGMDGNISINQEEYNLLKKWNSQTAYFVHGIGLEIKRFQGKQGNRERIREEFGIPAEAKVVLSIGELDDNKNHITVINALKSIPEVYYVICGVGPNEEKLKKSGLGDRLILSGYRKDIQNIIGASDVFALPSFHEGMPVSLMEAMAGELPVICSRIRGNVDLVSDGKNGYLANPVDILEWKSKLKSLVTDKPLCESFKQESLLVLQDYSKENVIGELMHVYSE